MELIFSIDESIALFFHTHMLGGIFDWLVKFISALGNHGFIWIAFAVALILFSPKYRQWGIVLLACLAASALVTNVFLKPFVARPRPFDVLGFDIIIPHPTDYSFPSGHTCAAFAAVAAAFSYNRRAGYAALIFAFFMGLSRLYLTVHFFTDVLAGAAIGFFVSQGVLFIFRRKHWISIGRKR